MSLILQAKQTTEYKPHPEGIHPAICVDVIDLGLKEVEYQGQRKQVQKVKLVFETEEKTEQGKCCTIAKTFTASIHPKSRLAEFLGKWRGRTVGPNEQIDLTKLINACCTLVVSHQQSADGRTFATIDAVSKPTKKLTASGHYDGTAARQRIADWNAKSGQPVAAPMPAPITGDDDPDWAKPVPAKATPTKSHAAKAAAVVEAPQGGDAGFDPEVGF